MVLGQIMLQMMYYGIVAILMVFVVGMLLRGFLFKYIKVRTSFGRLVMVKIRSNLRDYFEKGWVEEGFLVFKHNKKEIRLALDNDSYFYRCLAVNWVDVDENRNALSKTDYIAVKGFDAPKFSDLLTRALMKPAVQSNREKIILILLIGIAIGILVVGFLVYKNYSDMASLTSQLAQIQAMAKGSVVGSSTAI